MRKYSYKIKNDKGQVLEWVTYARTKAEAINSFRSTDFFVNGEIYKLVKGSFKWVD